MDKYRFDWNIVLEHCPEYKKYLVDIRSLKNDAEEDVIPEVTSFDEMFGHRTDEELEVMRQMGDGATGSTRYGMQRLEESEITMPESEIPKKDTIHYTLNPKYENPPLTGKMNPLQLPPPKCVLDVGSKLYFTGDVGWHMHYRVSGSSYQDGSVDLVKFKVNDKEDKIQLVKAVYWFNRKKNVIKDRSAGFKCLTYNKKTRNLYYVFRGLKNSTARRTAKRYASNVRGILLDRSTLVVAISDTPVLLLKSFINAVEKAVLKDVPDAYVPIRPPPKPRKPWNFGGRNRIVVDTQDMDEGIFLQNKLFILLLQHKANTRLDWLNPNVLSNIGKLLSIQGFEEQVTGVNILIDRSLEYEDYLKYIKNERKRRVRKVVPALKTSSLKALTKSICGKYYAKILVKLMNTTDIDSHNWITLMKTLHYGRMPKFLYHWLSNLLNGIRNNETDMVISGILRTLSDLNTTNKQERDRTITILELWVKTSKRFLKQGGFTNTWFTWRDMYNMADRMNIRLRANKFKDEADVSRQHDMLSELTNRDTSMLQDYDNITFREFAIPDKKYDGFTFVQLRNVEELVNEGRSMHHCVGGYANRCVPGNSIMFSMRKGNRGYVTIELSGKSLPYTIHQKYSIDDVVVTNEFALELMERWITDVNKLHEKDGIPYNQKCKNVDDTLKAERRLKKLTELKKEAGIDTLPHINTECAQLELQLATLALETARTPELELEPEYDADIVGMMTEGLLPY
jgi:hypothetical protein